MKKAEVTNRAAYPKVKVRGEIGLTTILEKTEVLILRVVRSLTFTKVSVGTVHSASDVKVTDVCSERAAVSSQSELPKGKSNEGSSDDNSPDSRSSPILRPRAVLSSPDNDGMIGSMNRRLSERPHSKLQDPKENKPSILAHRNTIEETPRVKIGSASTHGALNASSNIGKQTHEPASRRSSISTQRSLETAETQKVHVTSPVIPTPRSPVTRPTQMFLSETRETTLTQRVHVTRPVTPPTPRSPIARPVTPTPRSPITRPVTPTPRSPVTRQATLTPRSPVTRPDTPTPKSPIRRPVTPTSRSPAMQSVTPAPRSPLTRPVTPTPRSPLRKPVTSTQKLPVWR